jgi:hypothetical protein
MKRSTKLQTRVQRPVHPGPAGPDQCVYVTIRWDHEPSSHHVLAGHRGAHCASHPEDLMPVACPIDGQTDSTDGHSRTRASNAHLGRCWSQSLQAQPSKLVMFDLGALLAGGCVGVRSSEAPAGPNRARSYGRATVERAEELGAIVAPAPQPGLDATRRNRRPLVTTGQTLASSYRARRRSRCFSRLYPGIDQLTAFRQKTTPAMSSKRMR